MTSPEGLFPSTSIPKKTAEHFSLTPWCKPILEDHSLHPFLPSSRLLKEHNCDTLTAITLQTPDTISHSQFFYSPSDSSRSFGEVLALLSLGTHVNGHIDTAHGGFTGVILDDMIGCAALIAKPRDKTIMTAYLHITYKNPIPTPGVVLGRSWVDKQTGRKIFGKATIEDGNGLVLAIGEALFITMDRTKLREKL
ncbi:hypothetical protein BCIN_11g01860 [Botrytis cinerea B05.10]|uniref:Thioesterase domain-containing protein n=3 Tax=Botryotinia fuckeliana TaxID=40559 RepID=A0A384JWY6_BOTFB|nr:hypothetical protein BCIN_11g01860 [Botrytis cinerea B05.10]ATZ54864.1 hypothetical protein BCIN_11g01860 [Botrytis cinerea B05.10]EMR86502.1 putative thioesterase superfamily protein [Botrytis cinerea BcDW1]CCD47675.1 similar to thioesterase family protein [Botrytis cinerea T4]